MYSIDTCNEWKYLAKGSANAIFSYIGSQNGLKGKVLRLRLSNSELSTLEIYKYFKSELFSRLKVYMLDIEIISLPGNFLNMLQENNKEINLDLTEENGLIMDNTFTYGRENYKTIKISKYFLFFKHEVPEEILFEFKPKWLYYPPKEHLNCRNCVLAKVKGQDFSNCNLRLLHKDGIEHWCLALQNGLIKLGYNIDIYNQLRACLSNNYNLIETLFELQNNIDFDIHRKLSELENESDVDSFLQFSMTLKDLSIFVNLTKQEIKLIDLDKKSTKKWSSWRKQELKLQNLYLRELGMNCCVKADK